VRWELEFGEIDPTMRKRARRGTPKRQSRGAPPCATHKKLLLFCSHGTGDWCATAVCLSHGAHVTGAPWLPVHNGNVN
jgi:hypothetical protein